MPSSTSTQLAKLHERYKSADDGQSCMAGGSGHHVISAKSYTTETADHNLIMFAEMMALRC